MGSPISQVQAPQTGQPMGKGPISQVMQRPDGLDQNAINANPQGFQQWQQDRDAFQQSNNMSGSSGKSGRITFPGHRGQPRVGQPNQYSNTVGPWDNASIGTQSPLQQSGKGKGA